MEFGDVKRLGGLEGDDGDVGATMNGTTLALMGGSRKLLPTRKLMLVAMPSVLPIYTF